MRERAGEGRPRRRKRKRNTMSGKEGLQWDTRGGEEEEGEEEEGERGKGRQKKQKMGEKWRKTKSWK